MIFFLTISKIVQNYKKVSVGITLANTNTEIKEGVLKIRQTVTDTEMMKTFKGEKAITKYTVLTKLQHWTEFIRI